MKIRRSESFAPSTYLWDENSSVLTCFVYFASEMSKCPVVIGETGIPVPPSPPPPVHLCRYLLMCVCLLLHHHHHSCLNEYTEDKDEAM